MRRTLPCVAAVALLVSAHASAAESLKIPLTDAFAFSARSERDYEALVCTALGAAQKAERGLRGMQKPTGKKRSVEQDGCAATSTEKRRKR